jgi:hypothetical protein
MAALITAFKSELDEPFPTSSPSVALFSYQGIGSFRANSNISLRGAFDISLIASIASHLTYWGDEDVNHFMLSQMLSRKSRHRLKGGSAVDKR